MEYQQEIDKDCQSSEMQPALLHVTDLTIWVQ